MGWHIERLSAWAVFFQHANNTLSDLTNRTWKRAARAVPRSVGHLVREFVHQRTLDSSALRATRAPRTFLHEKGARPFCGGKPELPAVRHVTQHCQIAEARSDTPDDSATGRAQPTCEELQLRLVIPSSIDNIVLVGPAVNAICQGLSLSPQDASQIELCVIEAVTNAIKHAYAGHPGNTVEVRVSTQADRLILQICDSGQAMTCDISQTFDFDPTDIPNLPEGGMGLFLMYSLMDEVSYTSHQGTNILTMTKTLLR
jgi:serine/threonine-protein kinase RsbW